MTEKLAEPNLFIPIRDETGRIVDHELGYAFYLPPWHPPTLLERAGHLVARFVAFVRETGIMAPVIAFIHIALFVALLLIVPTLFVYVCVHAYIVEPFMGGYRAFPAQAGTEIDTQEPTTP